MSEANESSSHDADSKQSFLVNFLSNWKNASQVTNTTRIALFIVVGFFFITTYATMTYPDQIYQMAMASANKCSRLFEPGSLKWNYSDGTFIWKPRNCALRYRSINESVACMKELTRTTHEAPYILFIGDSRARQLREGLILALTGQDYDAVANRQARVDPAFHKALNNYAEVGTYFETAASHLRFQWASFLDHGKGSLSQLIRKLTEAEFKPSLVVVGLGAWQIRQYYYVNTTHKDGAKEYGEQFGKLLPLLQKLATFTNVIWLPQAAVHEQLLDDKHDMFTSKIMMMYNKKVRDQLELARSSKGTPTITYWQSAWEASLKINDGLDGVHYGYNTKHILIQMLVDWMCRPVSRNLEHVHDLQSSRSSDYCCY
ncbi:putative CAS1 domain-containing protein 1 [Hypsibius exemplaris]|uniref:CAS1 domain-containing protein 1 n=1 Tax=Hypsibius exemplaris TaxID=2072580 RepID=A0A9X6NLH8_HYPEX|nr:putative CAS1 domain-containing protein 1 [Hypsibius exemplaris]